jgi:plasmid stability protein
MSSLTIKDIPDELLEQLRERARDERRSLTQQVLVLLEKALATDVIAPPDRVSEQVEAWRRLAGGWVADESTDVEIRRLYEARTPGRDVDL